jgi:hypothetical protein
MDWYCNWTEHLLNEDNIKVGRESFDRILQQLKVGVVELYKALLLYQMKSVCSYYGNQGVTFLRGLVNPGRWDDALKSVTAAEDALQKHSEQYNTLHATSQFRDMRQALQDLIAQQKDMYMDNEYKECLRHLRVVDPRDDMKKIEGKKEELLNNAYEWILLNNQYKAFTNWSNEESASPPCRLLWIKGAAGTGKTMLLIGIIRKLSDQSAVLAPNVSYFFCQGTDLTLNNATATLRSLIWLLLVQQPYLISHLREKYKVSGETLFTDENAFNTLSGAFRSMLGDPHLSRVYLVVDALDECDQGLGGLIQLISTSLQLSDKIKWLVSSRPYVGVLPMLKDLNPKNLDPGTPLELDDQSLEGSVNAYITSKLSTLANRNGYTEDILGKVSDEFRQRKEKTFLWVGLVFKELDARDEDLDLVVPAGRALDTIKQIPSSLKELYSDTMAKIQSRTGDDRQHCMDVLVATVLARRPLSLSELAVLAGLPSDMHWKIVKKCRLFLTTKEETVYLVHQSAKEYLEEKQQLRLPQSGAVLGHANISRRSIGAMSTLKRNIYDLPHWGVESKDIRPPASDRLAPLRYSCLFWVDHLCDGQSSESKNNLWDKVTVFLKEHFLHWLESLSLLGKFPEGVLSIRKLLRVVQVCLTSAITSIMLSRDSRPLILKDS